MYRSCILGLMLLAALTAFAATAKVTVNGKTVTVPVLQQNGKSYVDVVALMKLLGGKVTINAGTPAPAASSAGAGTVQMAGDNGELGKVYSIVKNDLLYFRLTSAEFTVGQVRIGETVYTPTADEKLLVLHFTVQNPDKVEKFARWDSLKMTAVDAMNVNHEYVQDWGDEENKGSFSMTMKPAQTIKLYTIIKVPAKGTVPKLMILPPTAEGGPVLRYDLRGKIAALPAPIADPADATGATALDTVPGALNVAYPYQRFNLTVEKFEYTTKPILNHELDEGERFLVVTLLAKNQSTSDETLRYDTFATKLVSTDGDELNYGGDLLLATAFRAFDQQVKAGSENRVRMFFTVLKDVTPKTLSLTEDESRTYTFEVK